MIEDEAVTDGDIATAAVQWTAALVGGLVTKGVLTREEARGIAADAQEQCRTEGVAKAARVSPAYPQRNIGR
jgi:polyhydroxyalkanoate synthesis regulator phasin